MRHGARNALMCVCDCGNVTGPVMAKHLRSGHTKSCGCLQRAAVRATGGISKHGHAKRIGGRSRTYRIWHSMLSRCNIAGLDNEKYYYAKGIKVCKRWHKFENFLADMGECPPSKTIDRINGSKNYTPANCRWATWSEQRKNQRR